jgi:tetratricopeptide (TPR) repeat protein
MSQSRVEALRALLAQNPNDTFARYGLAIEFSNSGKLEEAVAEYRSLIQANPNYSAAYFHGGQALEKLGRIEDAREMYQRGIEVTTQTGDLHTRSELQAALDMLS